MARQKEVERKKATLETQQSAIFFLFKMCLVCREYFIENCVRTRVCEEPSVKWSCCHLAGR